MNKAIEKEHINDYSHNLLHFSPSLLFSNGNQINYKYWVLTTYA